MSISESVFGIVCIFPAFSVISNRAVPKGKIATDAVADLEGVPWVPSLVTNISVLRAGEGAAS